MELDISRQIFEKSSNITFYGNPSIRRRVVQCGRTDMTKQVVAFRKFANTPKKITPQYKEIGFSGMASSMHSTKSGQIFAIPALHNSGPLFLHGWKAEWSHLLRCRFQAMSTTRHRLCQIAIRSDLNHSISQPGFKYGYRNHIANGHPSKFRPPSQQLNCVIS